MLGSPNPQTNNVAEETLDVSAFRILTGISLLMPAFSLLTAPHRLSPQLHRCQNALLPIKCATLETTKMKPNT